MASPLRLPLGLPRVALQLLLLGLGPLFLPGVPLPCAAISYGVGDYVPVSRQGQFHNLRTRWHDLIGRHCPRFGLNRVVVLPIPQPIGFTFNQDTYKLKLQLGRERFVTGWLTLMGKGSAYIPPFIHLQLAHFAGEFRGVKAKVIPLPQKYLAQHQQLVIEWGNATHWPKHVIMQYQWKEQLEVDVTAGLILLFGASFSLTTILALYILQSSKDKLARFMSEQLAESPAVAAATALGGDVPKVD